ncbi:MupA/Atu3671 family FMN-dependent luciferase-like monooxygenase [Microbulbifer sp. ANSA003]|uniref:MupA/Atu3671 family FMN-dependent luciferase-like monooxygenase n=1 Tax=Microbulbifer sp. ANSA003 TaxID=3243360 RepID=UPI0040424DCE
MQVQALVNELNESGIFLFVSDGKLKAKSKPGALTPERAELIKNNKEQLLSFLTAAGDQEKVAMERVDRDQGCELSFSQQRLWFLNQLAEGTSAYNMPLALALEGELDIELAESAFNTIIGRHETLRTCFIETDGEVRQFIRDEVEFSLPVQDLSHLSGEALESRIECQVAAEAERLFMLDKDLMLRACLLRCSKDRHILLITMHHIASDGWSLGLLTEEFCELYNAGQEQRLPVLPQLSYQYADYAVQQKKTMATAAAQAELNTFKQALEKAPRLHSIPLDKARPTEQKYHGELHRQRLSPELSEQLRRFAGSRDVSLFALMETVFAILIGRFSRSEDVVFGMPVANRTDRSMEKVMGFFANTLVLNHQLPAQATFSELLTRHSREISQSYSAQHIPFESLVEAINPERELSYNPLFQIFIAFENASPPLQLQGLKVDKLEHYHKFSKFDLSLYIKDEADGIWCGWEYNSDLFELKTVEVFAQSYLNLLGAALSTPQASIATLLVQAGDDTRGARLGATLALDGADVCEQIFQQAEQSPDAPALVFQDQRLSYGELSQQVLGMSQYLQQAGVKKGDRVGIYLPRNTDLVVAMLAVMACGAAYIPLDPEYPESRLSYIADNAQVAAVIVASDDLLLPFGDKQPVLALDSARREVVHPLVRPALSLDLPAYLIYTSGSTGKPKGVVVSHRNVVNLFSALDQQLPLDGEQKALLAVTSVSFDISVLELFWTLSRGQKVVLYPSQNRRALDTVESELPEREQGGGLNFSLYYFATDPERAGHDKYGLLKAGAEFADKHGFEAVWVPERHFHEFGGQFPNPTIAAAALSLATKQLQLRAGSVVLPLHNPINVAEDWSMVDNLSQGRAGLAVTCGWHFNDFVFAPDNYDNRYEIMFKSLDIVRNLWRGEGHWRRAGNGEQNEVKIRPLPVQAEIPVWITTAGNPETFRRAGLAGANLLTHILGQSPRQLAEKIQVYRNARAEAGLDPNTGRVSVMVHTFVSEDMETAEAIAKAPFKEYLRSSIGLLKPFAKAQGWGTDVDPEQLLEAGCERYFRTNALFGTVEHCAKLAMDLYNAGVDEIASLIDFGVDAQIVVKHLDNLQQLHVKMARHTAKAEPQQSFSEVIRQEQVTWLQSTPSLAHLMMSEGKAEQAFAQLECLMLGGEYLSPAVLRAIASVFSGRLFNMYGPTETTVWSSVTEIIAGDSIIGEPLANTQFYLLDDALNVVPQGMIGELYIGGEGVTLGYFEQAGLTAERYIPDPFSETGGQRLYRTGDLMRIRHDGALEFCGRRDFQVKLRGYRIELGDIEEALLNNEQVSQAVAAVRKDQNHNERLVGYVTSKELAETDNALSVERVDSWQALYNETFVENQAQTDPSQNFASWVSSYTAQAYPLPLMQEWICNTVARIPHDEQSRILEIGVGTGLILFRVAPKVAGYIGVDFADNGLNFISKHSAFLGEKASSIALHKCAADQFQAHVDGKFDTIILNSVVQYFPSADYLRDVLQQGLEHLEPGGKIYVGDVRHYQLHELFCSSVELAQARPGDRLIQLRHRISERVAHERELLLDPSFFKELGLEQLTRVEILVKAEQAHTEMSKYRYDVILHTGEVEAAGQESRLIWQQDVFTVAEVVAELDQTQPELIVVDALPHPLLDRDLKSAALLAGARQDKLLSELASVHESEFNGQTRVLLDAVRANGYTATLSWDHTQAPHLVSMQLRRSDAGHLASRREMTLNTGNKQASHNNPLQSEQSLALIPSLQRTARKYLPEFMQPDTYIVVERWPYTANGKIDVAKLPVPEAQVQKRHEYTAPTNELESNLVELWREILNLEQVGVTSNFFELGGRSLLAAQMLNRIKERWQIELTVKALFENPTISQLAKYMSRGSQGSDTLALKPVSRQQQLPASELQQGLWFAVHKDTDGTMYHMAIGVELTGDLNLANVQLSLQALVERHEILKCTFELERGELTLNVNPELEIPIPVIDISDTPEQDLQIRQWQELNAFKAAPFDLVAGPLVRLGILKLSPKRHILMYVIHHLISDGWSNRLLIGEFMENYQQLASGGSLAFEPLTVQYPDYAYWMKQHFDQDKLNGQLSYWQEQLHGLADLMPLPWDKARTDVVSDQGMAIDFALTEAASARLKAVCAEMAITPYMFTLAAWQLLLAAWSEQDDIVIGSPVSNRPSAELEKLVGYFVNTVVLRSRVADELDWRDFLKQIKSTTLDAYGHQDIPFSRVVEAISPQRTASHMPIYQVAFSFESIRSLPQQFAGLAVQQLREPETLAKYDLSLTLIEFEHQLQGSISFKQALFERSTIELVTGQFSALIEHLLEMPSDPLQAIKQRVRSAFVQQREQVMEAAQQNRIQRLQSRRRRQIAS